METIQLCVSDETLRDGAQQVGLFLEDSVKRNIAHLIAKTGVRQLAVMPAVHESEAQFLQSLVSEGLDAQLVASTMMGKRFIDQAKACGVQQIILFHAVSDRLLWLRDSEVCAACESSVMQDNLSLSLIQAIRQRMLDKVVEHLRYARDIGLRVCFAAEDASRADFDFLVHCINTFGPYLDYFLLCDSVGILTPEKSYIWVQDLLQSTNRVPLSVHFHNDMGMALENTIQAVYAGAQGISGTFGGIGERAGNVALEQVLNGLQIRFGWRVAGIDYDVLEQVLDYFAQLGVRANAPYSKQAQRCEAGIHVNALLKDVESYSMFSRSQPDIWFGKCSGVSNFKYLFEKCLNRPLAQEQYERLRSEIKQLAIQRQCSFSADKILEFIDQGILKV